MSEEAIKELIKTGVLGSLLVLALLAVVYLQKQRDAESRERLKDMRDALITTAETNNLLLQLKEAVTGLVTSNASVVTTLSTVHALIISNAELMRTRDDRVERVIEKNAEAIQRIESGIRETEGTIDGLRDVVRAGRAV